VGGTHAQKGKTGPRSPPLVGVVIYDNKKAPPEKTRKCTSQQQTMRASLS